MSRAPEFIVDMSGRDAAPSYRDTARWFPVMGRTPESIVDISGLDATPSHRDTASRRSEHHSAAVGGSSLSSMGWSRPTLVSAEQQHSGNTRVIDNARMENDKLRKEMIVLEERVSNLVSENAFMTEELRIAHRGVAERDKQINNLYDDLSRSAAEHKQELENVIQQCKVGAQNVTNKLKLRHTAEIETLKLEASEDIEKSKKETERVRGSLTKTLTRENVLRRQIATELLECKKEKDAMSKEIEDKTARLKEGGVWNAKITAKLKTTEERETQLLAEIAKLQRNAEAHAHSVTSRIDNDHVRILEETIAELEEQLERHKESKVRILENNVKERSKWEEQKKEYERQIKELKDGLAEYVRTCQELMESYLKSNQTKMDAVVRAHRVALSASSKHALKLRRVIQQRSNELRAWKKWTKQYQTSMQETLSKERTKVKRSETDLRLIRATWRPRLQLPENVIY